MHLGYITTLAIGSNRAEEPAGAPWLAPEAAIRTKIVARIAIVFSSGRAELFFQGQLPNALASRGEDRVGQRGPGDGGARFADPPGLLEVANEVHFDRRRLVAAHHPNVVHVGLVDTAVLERHAAPEGAADSEDDPSLDLGLHRVGIHHRPAIDRADDSVHADLARLRHRNFGDLSEIAVPGAVEDRDPAA